MKKKKTDRGGNEMKAKKIVFQFTQSTFFTRRPCNICGGWTGKVYTLCEVLKGKHKGLRICERCLEAGRGKVDAAISNHAARLEAQAAYLKSLQGRIEIPTYEACMV